MANLRCAQLKWVSFRPLIENLPFSYHGKIATGPTRASPRTATLRVGILDTSVLNIHPLGMKTRRKNGSMFAPSTLDVWMDGIEVLGSKVSFGSVGYTP